MVGRSRAQIYLIKHRVAGALKRMVRRLERRSSGKECGLRRPSGTQGSLGAPPGAGAPGYTAPMSLRDRLLSRLIAGSSLRRTFLARAVVLRSRSP